jgi:hypothetical protein
MDGLGNTKIFGTLREILGMDTCKLTNKQIGDLLLEKSIVIEYQVEGCVVAPGRTEIHKIKLISPSSEGKTMEMPNQSVCVDLDGTLLYYTNWKGMDGRLGEPRPGAREFLINIKKFAKIIIFTSRLAEGNKSKETFDQISSWFKRHDLPYDELYTGCGKPIAEVFVDDKAISIPKNPVELDFDEALIQIRRFVE